jgi:hypothetical protein
MRRISYRYAEGGPNEIVMMRKGDRELKKCPSDDAMRKSSWTETSSSRKRMSLPREAIRKSALRHAQFSWAPSRKLCRDFTIVPHRALRSSDSDTSWSPVLNKSLVHELLSCQRPFPSPCVRFPHRPRFSTSAILLTSRRRASVCGRSGNAPFWPMAYPDVLQLPSGAAATLDRTVAWLGAQGWGAGGSTHIIGCVWCSCTPV